MSTRGVGGVQGVLYILLWPLLLSGSIPVFLLPGRRHRTTQVSCLFPSVMVTLLVEMKQVHYSDKAWLIGVSVG